MAREPHETFWELVKDIKVCMMTTVDGGVLRARPMMPQIDPVAGEFRFLTERSSAKVAEIEDEARVGLSFADPSGQDFVSVSGNVRLSQDRALIRRLWNPYAEAFFKSPDDPDVSVLIFTPTEAQYWDGTGSRLKQAWQTLKALGAHKKPELGEVRKVAF